MWVIYLFTVRISINRKGINAIYCNNLYFSLKKSNTGDYLLFVNDEAD